MSAPLPWVVPLVVLGLLAVAALCDLKSREIPDWISLALLALAVVATALGWHGVVWWQLAAGLALGFALTAPLFYMGGIGGGDVKLVAALGAVLGAWGLLAALFWVALAGGVLALIAKLRGQSDFAYVPAIFLGTLAALLWSGGLMHD
jgi:prepilin peptidase CpaA